MSPSSRPVPLSEISMHERIIVVMGPTGAGKSTFIAAASKMDDDEIIGHGLESCTSDIRSIKTVHPIHGYPVTFIDTPGFDDTYKSDVDILTMIANWLSETYKSKLKLAGIVYLHRISDNRMGGASLKNLRMFSSICGFDAMPGVILVTSMWDETHPDIGAQREEELKEKFWKDLLEHGCRTERFDRTLETAWDIIGNLSHRDQAPLQLPVDMVDTHLSLKETHAGVTLHDELAKLLKAQKDATNRLKQQAAKLDNPQAAQHLDARRREIELKMKDTTDQLQQTKINAGRKVHLYLKGHSFKPS